MPTFESTSERMEATDLLAKRVAAPVNEAPDPKRTRSVVDGTLTTHMHIHIQHTITHNHMYRIHTSIAL